MLTRWFVNFTRLSLGVGFLASFTGMGVGFGVFVAFLCLEWK